MAAKRTAQKTTGADHNVNIPAGKSATITPQTAPPEQPSKGPKLVNDPAKAALMALLKVEAEARSVETVKELVFLIANETRKLVRARQVFVLRGSPVRKLKVTGVNSMDAVNRNTPLVRWIERLVQRLKKDTGLGQAREFTLPAYCSQKDEETSTYPFANMAWIPFILKDGTVFGGVLLAREQPWLEADTIVAKRLADTYGHAWAALAGKRVLRRTGRAGRMAAILGVMCLFAGGALPVPITALAPAEIVAVDPFVVASPIDGVVDEVVIEPNTRVKKGDLLVRFVDTSLRNKLAVAERQVRVARARLKRYSQAAFDDPAAKRELRTAQSELALKVAERDFARDLMARSQLRAPRAGLAVFAGRRDWAGRPVSVGERIMTIADPKHVQLSAELAVNDAITLHKGARVKVFLDSDPIHALEAVVTSAGHEAVKTRSNMLAYRVIARLKPVKGKVPRLGVRGTAQLFGRDAPVFLYLFRRPLSALRQRIGL